MTDKAQTSPVSKSLRFYMDHGVIHDRVTGKHVVTDGDWPFEDTAEMVCQLLNSLTETPRGNYEDRHPNDMVLHPLSEIREWDEALAVLGIQDSDQTPADAIRELNAEIERLRGLAQTPDLRAAVIEECAKVLDEAAQDWNRIRDPGMANNARSYARKIRALTQGPDTSTLQTNREGK